MLKDFNAFILRGNVIDLAIAVVLGTAFAAVVASVVDLLTNIVAIPGKTNFSALAFHAGGGTFKYGAFLQAVINFLVVASVLFFVVVRPLNALMTRRKTEPDVESPTRDCPECLSSIPVGARRCAFCTAEVGVGA
ncbi:MAG: mscL [Acidimicrobiales bacterium]|nr:mscL [Acidimicrobiales bacterium]